MGILMEKKVALNNSVHRLEKKSQRVFLFMVWIQYWAIQNLDKVTLNMGAKAHEINLKKYSDLKFKNNRIATY